MTEVRTSPSGPQVDVTSGSAKNPYIAWGQGGGPVDGEFMIPFDSGLSASAANPDVVVWMAPYDCSLKNLTFKVSSGSSPLSGSGTVTVTVDGVNTDITATISNGEFEATDDVHTANVLRGQFVRLQMAGFGGADALLATLEILPTG